MKPTLHKGMTDFTSGYVPPVTPDGFRPGKAPDKRLRGARLIKLLIVCVLLFILSFVITSAAIKISRQPPDGLPADAAQVTAQEGTTLEETVTDYEEGETAEPDGEDETQEPEPDEEPEEPERDVTFNTEDSDG